MKRKILISNIDHYLTLTLLFTMFFSISGWAQSVIYVNDDASGSNDGTSWNNAYTDLQIAINSASVGDSVFVAQGVYQPASGSFFSMKQGVKIYGGFLGNEASLSKRDLSAEHTSILKGNEHRVITNNNNGLSHDAILDGFMITGGERTSGGGMLNINASPTISNCIFSGNEDTGGGGGGMQNSTSSPIIINCIFSGNKSSYSGGGIFNTGSSSKPILINCTISGNYANNNGGGISFSFGSTSIIANSIVYGNLDNSNDDMNDYHNCDGCTQKISYSLIGGLSSEITNIDGSVDPLFINAPSASTAPFTISDYHLRIKSPAINKGKNDSIPLGVDFDVEGNPRIYDKSHGGIVDMGAYEYQGISPSIIYVDSAASGNNSGGSWDNAFTDLKAAINSAVNGDSIFVAKGTYQPMSGSYFEMKYGVKIYGGFAGNETSLSERNLGAEYTSILKGNGQRVITNNGNGLAYNAVLDGFTITGGNHTSGGGMLNINASPTIANCIFSGNEDTGGGGGGMQNSTSSPIIINCVFSGNKSSYFGGGIFNTANSDPTVINSTISGNYANNGGGGIAYSFSSTSTISNSIVYGNLDHGNDDNNDYRNCGGCIQKISYSLIGGVGSGATNIDGSTDPLFVDAPSASTAPFIGGNYRLQNISPVINKGNNDSIPVGVDIDLGGDTRINLTNGSIVDLGAYENQGGPPVIILQPKDTIACYGSDVSFFVNSIGQSLLYQWQVSKNQGKTWNNEDGDNDTLKLLSIAPSDSGYKYRAIVSNPNGKDTSNVAILGVKNSHISIIDQPVSQKVNVGDSAIFSVTTSGDNLSYQWQYLRAGDSIWVDIPLGVEKDIEIPNANVSKVSYRVIVSSDCENVTSEAATLSVLFNTGESKLDCNNVVSPNGDGKNDTWFIQNINDYPDNRLMIFDRMGHKVYEDRGYNNQWDGKINGASLQEGTYYYIFIVNNGKKVFKGFIEIIR